MAGDWIKMRGALLDHPKVIAMTRALQADRLFRNWLTPGGSGQINGQIVADHALRCVTTALLMKVWSVAREHGKFVGDDLVLQHSSISDIDQMAGAPGVGVAMKGVKWIVENDGLTLPNFIEFNVPMSNAEKQAEYRKRQKSAENDVTKALPTRSNGIHQSVTTREEKSRTKELPPNPRDLAIADDAAQQYPPAFERFWKAYPKRVGKGDALRAWKRAKVGEPELMTALAWQTRSEDWVRENGRYIPNPATYLNHRRWEDSPHSVPQGTLSSKRVAL